MLLKLYMFVLEPFFKFLAIKKNLKNDNYEINPLIILMNLLILAAPCSTFCAISSTKSKAFSLTSEFFLDISFSNSI